jgi:DNA-binding protein YbaB
LSRAVVDGGGAREKGGAGVTEPLEKRLEKAMAELQAAQEAVARTERELRQASFAVLSSDRAVRATVGPQGELTGIEFLENKYRDMSPQELAASVLEAASAARVKLQDELRNEANQQREEDKQYQDELRESAR